MTNNHKSRIDKLELRVKIDHPPALVLDFDQLQDGELEVLEHASEILARAEWALEQDGGTLPEDRTKAYMAAVFPFISDEDLEILERAATIQERIQIHDNRN